MTTAAASGSAPPRGWINRQYFTEILERYYNADVVVLSYIIEDGSPKGQNFLSSIIRAKVTYRQRWNERSTISLILKTGMADPELAANVQYVLGIEKAVYGPIMREISELLLSYGDCTSFGPQMLYEDENAFVLEDLSIRGYTQPDRKARLDMDHCRLLIAKLAKFHATTAVVGQKHRDLFELHMTSAFLDKTNQIRRYYKNCVAECVAVTEAVPELAEYRGFLKKLEATIIDRECHTFTRNENGYNVLNHGDLWLNNILWKYDSRGRVEDVLLIDYQECFFGSPGIDLNHFLYSSANNDVQLSGFDELLELYVDELQSALTLFKYEADIPTLDSIKQEMRHKRDHAAVVTLCIVPALIMERTELATPENMLDNTSEAKEARREVFSNPRFVDILKILLPKLAAE